MKPYVETVFRNPLLLLVPAMLIPLLVAGFAFLTGGRYEVKATVWTQVSPLLGTSTGVVKPPAEIEAQTFNERLATESFRAAILSKAGLEEEANAGEWPSSSGLSSLLVKTPFTSPLAGFFGGAPPSTDQQRRDRALTEVENTLRAEAQGNNLVHVLYVGGDTDAGVALVDAALKVYEEENLGQTSQQAQVVLGFYEEQVAERQKELAEADADLRAFEAEHPVGAGEARIASEAQELAQLQMIYNIRLSQYELALDRQSEAQERAEVSVTTMNNNFGVVDPPQRPLGTVLDMRRTAATTFIGIVFGVGLGGVLVALRTWFRQTLQRREDVEQVLGLPLLAALPDFKKGGH
jgi:uncharacterized protein involved in exopolysaccharide biosynthesis